MGHWNHKVMRHTEVSPGTPPVVYYAVHEVYYHDDGSVMNWTEAPVGATGEDMDDLAQYLELMTMALKHPVLDYQTGEEV